MNTLSPWCSLFKPSKKLSKKWVNSCSINRGKITTDLNFVFLNHIPGHDLQLPSFLFFYSPFPILKVALTWAPDGKRGRGRLR